MIDFEKYEELIPKIIMDGMDVAKAKAALIEWAKGEDDVKDQTIWAELPAMDLSQDIDTIAGWLKAGIGKLAANPKADTVFVALGECEWLFDLIGYAHESGQKGVPTLVQKFKDRDFSWEEDIDFGEEADLGLEYASDLPGEIWKVIAEGEDEARANEDAGMMLWGVVAHLAIAKALGSGDIDFAAALGKREQVALFAGFEDAPSLIGVMTPEGWKADYS